MGNRTGTDAYTQGAHMGAHTGVTGDDVTQPVSHRQQVEQAVDELTDIVEKLSRLGLVRDDIVFYVDTVMDRYSPIFG